MRSLIIFLFVSYLSVTLSSSQRKWVHVCTSNECKLPDCQCSETRWTGSTNNSQQFVVLSFDDAVSDALNQNLLPTFLRRKNPDGCSISGTFFVPHEYTDYVVVNKLYNLGYEIGSHSITKNFSQDYWRNASVSTLISEFAGQRTILSKFANISEKEILGVRVPQLQINKNTFKALRDGGFTYDASWPTQQPWTFYPYTLDYTSRQQCHTLDCQVESTPGLWEMPIIDWIDNNGISCNSLHSCAVEKNIFQWMKKNYLQIKRSGAPIALRVSYSWFISWSHHAEALNEFLNYLETEDNTYIVSYKQLLDWSKNPTTNFSSCQIVNKQNCERGADICKYFDGNGGDRYISVCGPCPHYYPWINNPLGDKPKY